MVRVLYDVNSGRLSNFFPIIQDGGGNTNLMEQIRFQRGYGRVFRRQKGRGLGNVLRGIWRYLMPIAKEFGSSLVHEGANVGARVLENIAQGKDIKEAVVTEGQKAAKSLARKAAEKLNQAGSGRKRRVILAPERLVGRSVLASAAKKRRRRDTLGFY